MSRFPPGVARVPVVDLRTQRTAAERMGRVGLALLGGLLGLTVVGALAALALSATMLLVPRSYDAAILPRGEPGDRKLVLVGLHNRPIEPQERIVAVDGVSLVGSSNPTADATDVVRASGTHRIILTVEPVDSASTGTAKTRRERRLEPVREPVDATVGALFAVLALLMGAMGLLVLGARAEGPAPQRFLRLCILGGFPMAVIAILTTSTLYRAPVEELFGAVFGIGGMEMLLVVAYFAWPVGFGSELLSLLYVFPTEEPELAKRFPSPQPSRGFGWMLRAGALSSVPLIVLTLLPVSRATLEPFLVGAWWLEGGVFLAGILYLITWLPQAARRVRGLVRFRREQSRDASETGRRAAVALSGIDVGVKAFVWTLTVALISPFAQAGVRLAWDSDGLLVHAVDVLVTLVSLALFVTALTAPFLGMGLAMLRGGLWDVDFVAHRAILYSLLGAAFFVAWAVADQAIQTLIPGGSSWVGPIVAAGSVALLQGPLARAIRRRVRAGDVDLDEVVERMAQRLSALVVRGAEAARAIASVLAEELRCDPAVLVRWDGEGWCASGTGTVPASDEGIGHIADVLRGSATAVVRTDGGNVLAARLGPASGMAGMALLGPWGGGRFYVSGERRMLSVALAPLAPLLRDPAGGGPAKA